MMHFFLIWRFREITNSTVVKLHAKYIQFTLQPLCPLVYLGSRWDSIMQMLSSNFGNDPSFLVAKKAFLSTLLSDLSLMSYFGHGLGLRKDKLRKQVFPFRAHKNSIEIWTWELQEMHRILIQWDFMQDASKWGPSECCRPKCHFVEIVMLW